MVVFPSRSLLFFSNFQRYACLCFSAFLNLDVVFHNCSLFSNRVVFSSRKLKMFIEGKSRKILAVCRELIRTCSSHY